MKQITGSLRLLFLQTLNGNLKFMRARDLIRFKRAYQYQLYSKTYRYWPINIIPAAKKLDQRKRYKENYLSLQTMSPFWSLKEQKRMENPSKKHQVFFQNCRKDEQKQFSKIETLRKIDEIQYYFKLQLLLKDNLTTIKKYNRIPQDSALVSIKMNILAANKHIFNFKTVQKLKPAKFQAVVLHYDEFRQQSDEWIIIYTRCPKTYYEKPFQRCFWPLQRLQSELYRLFLTPSAQLVSLEDIYSAESILGLQKNQDQQEYTLAQ